MTSEISGPLSSRSAPLATLSAVVCARNEEHLLRGCLANLLPADEIVVLLDRCTDRSEQIALEFAHCVIAGSFPLEGTRRAASVNVATSEWILEIDADEEISAELLAEVRRRIADSGGCDFFRIPVDNYVGDRLIRYGWGGKLGTTLVARLYRRGAKFWGNEQVHPSVQFAGREGAALVSPIKHSIDGDISDMLLRFERYTALHAIDLRRRPRGGIVSNVFRGFRRFYKSYVQRKGYREGGWGFLISLLAGLYPLISTLRARLEPAPSLEDDGKPAQQPRIIRPRA